MDTEKHHSCPQSTQCTDDGKRMASCPFSWHIGYEQLCSASDRRSLHVDAEYSTDTNQTMEFCFSWAPMWNSMLFAMPNKSLPLSVIQHRCDYITAVYNTALWQWKN